MALAQPPYDLWFAFLIAGPVCFWLWSAARGRSAAAAFWTG